MKLLYGFHWKNKEGHRRFLSIKCNTIFGDMLFKLNKFDPTHSKICEFNNHFSNNSLVAITKFLHRINYIKFFQKMELNLKKMS